MNKKILILIVLFVLSCKSKTSLETLMPIEDNKELQSLFEEDQLDRQNLNSIGWEIVLKNDSLRKIKLYKLLNSNNIKTSLDYHNAAMLFQHGGDTISSSMAIKLIKKSIELDSTTSKWLLAAAIDRDLMFKNKPQIYGTQYSRSENSLWDLYKIDTTIISDNERIKYGVRTLAQQRARVIKMNKKNLTEFLESKNIDEVVLFCRKEYKINNEYDLSEEGVNVFGYDLMKADRIKDALKIFKLNTELYPNGYNTYDSYGECLLKFERKEEALKAFEKSLELNPKNENAKMNINKIKGN
jgi:tetratricopeptide (TPR) repeat protein